MDINVNINSSNVYFIDAIGGRNLGNGRYRDETVLITDSEGKLKISSVRK